MISLNKNIKPNKFYNFKICLYNIQQRSPLITIVIILAIATHEFF
ncbi:MAG: hypothetical protein V7K25_30935 [Nostoc sp.]